MPSIKIEGVAPYDGTHELSVRFTNRELHTIKQITGVRAGELEAATAAGDLDLVVALAVIALQQGGHTVNVDALWDAEAGLITLVPDDAEADAVPPPEPPASGELKTGGTP